MDETLVEIFEISLKSLACAWEELCELCSLMLDQVTDWVVSIGSVIGTGLNLILLG